MLHDVDKEPNRLLEHGRAEFVVEFWKPRSIDAVVLFEAAKVEPVAAELGRQPTHAVVAEHPSRLLQQHFAVMQISRRCMLQQFSIRNA